MSSLFKITSLSSSVLPTTSSTAMITADSSDNVWPNSKDDYRLDDILGRGATANVYKAHCPPRNEDCVVKRVVLEKCHICMTELNNEVCNLRMCNHRNIVKYHTSFIVRNELWLVMGIQKAGSLFDIITYKWQVTNCKNGVFDEVTIATVLKEILKGLEYLHSSGYMHRDIKSSNILVGNDGSVKICDFGLSTFLGTKNNLIYKAVGTPYWMAPEVILKTCGYNSKADIWAVGIIGLEMITGFPPNHLETPVRVLLITRQNEALTVDSVSFEVNQYKIYSEKFRNFLTKCLQKDPALRSPATELLSHTFFDEACTPHHIVKILLPFSPTLRKLTNKDNEVDMFSSVNSTRYSNTTSITELLNVTPEATVSKGQQAPDLFEENNSDEFYAMKTETEYEITI